jgi:hypothetical protein
MLSGFIVYVVAKDGRLFEEFRTAGHLDDFYYLTTITSAVVSLLGH